MNHRIVSVNRYILLFLFDYLYTMLNEISINDYLSNYTHVPLIDVRSPGEYAHGHIPCATSIPLFTNDERAKVGTVYKQQSKEEAIALGYKFVTPKLQWYIEESQKIAPDTTIAVHCWRGGMRSKSFAQHLHDNGFKRVYVITGGYKAFRNHVISAFNREITIYILGGYTGSGKTPLLEELKKKGEQVIDLEGIANHKGSAFGRIGMGQQPSSEQFDNNLFWEWNKLDYSKHLWLEDESANIGDVNLQANFYARMRNAQAFFLDIPLEARASQLVNDYALGNDDKLESSILRISKRLGGLSTKQSLEALKNKEYKKVATIALVYYDKYYLKGLRRRNPDNVVKIELATTDVKTNAAYLLEAIETLTNDKH